MSLKEYNRKRNFKQTPEPSSKGKSSPATLAFSVQEHHATRLHYDLRLEHRGVLLSWAVPKGPSFDPKDKRLAIKVEDHPLSYREFEGVIPKGNYGAGQVILWDTGTYTVPDCTTKKEMEKKIDAGLEKGHLEVEFDGKRLHGRYDLIHLKNDEKENIWIMVKKKETANELTAPKKTRKASTSKKKPLNP